MIGPSDLYRVPLAVKATQREELLRYARLEHQDADLSWSQPASRPSGVRWTGFRVWLSSHFGSLRTRAPSVEPVALRPSLAAVHFGGEASDRLLEPQVDLGADHARSALAASTVILTVQPSQPCRDEACTCEQ
jgi:hypothetical protein